MRVRRNGEDGFLRNEWKFESFSLFVDVFLETNCFEKNTRQRIGGREGWFALETFHLLKALLSWAL